MGAHVSVSLVFIAVVMSQLSNPLLPQKINNGNNTINLYYGSFAYER